MKIDFFYVGGEHTWSFLPTVQGWRNDFRNFDHGDNYALTLKFLNKCIGINIKL